ncbi:Sodium/proline symporter [Seminavis robusta]|uniref:Sodium/proline symporter n=1 Tax=Seminavis robusta TaxID=568900 RepID=A0A9N8DN30_9STRA|nr:Sodium/proline symporter [Seminavis robusta]|eukprot:Sro174_g076830.1 Sodium/proline symporter (773) ;mRNA; r:88616-91366
MSLEEHKTGLYVIISIYFCVLLVCAVWANIQNRRTANRQTARNNGVLNLSTNSTHGSAEVSARNNINGLASGASIVSAIGFSPAVSENVDILYSHYLGGRSLGPVLTTGTIFASFFSGYTVVGIPNEAYSKNGFMALRWLASSMAIMTGVLGTGLRLRKAALVRNHKTSVDFITDRFQSQVLRYTVLILQIVPSIFYLTAQVVALKSTFNSIFGLDQDEAYPVLIIMAITLLLEWVGGLRCVAMTDCVQGGVMAVAYLCLPPIIAKHFGGWKSIDPTVYPRPDFYQTPTRAAQLNMWQFCITLFSFFSFPHMMQRNYAARDLVSLKYAYATMGAGVWVLMLGGVFIGTVAVQILKDLGKDETVTNAFTELLSEVIGLGGFPKLVGLLAVTATLAAIMSTADSLLVAISQLVTEEVVYPFSPDASPATMVWVGRAVSFCAVVISSLMGISWDKGVSEVASINFQLSAQSIWIFLIGLFAKEDYDCHPWILAFSAMITFVYVFAIYFGYIASAGADVALDAGVSGLAIQLALIVVLESIRRKFFPERRDYRPAPMMSLDRNQQAATQRDLIFNRPKWDVPRRSRFGEKPLTPDLLWRMMNGVKEPMTNAWYSLLMFFAILWSTPWVLPGVPDNIQNLGETLLGSLPWWVVNMIATLLIPTVMMYYSIYVMPNRFPRYVRRTPKRTRSGSAISLNPAPAPSPIMSTPDMEEPDPDVLELTPEELAHRTAYDERNDLVYKRRRQILEKLGIPPTEIDSIVASTQQQLQNYNIQPHL